MIPLVDLRRQHEPLRKEIDAVIKKLIDKSAFILGEEVQEFEKEFAKFCGTKYALGVACGTDALQLTVLALGIGPGDEVISVPNTFTATIDAIAHAGAKTVLVDCDEYFNIDIAQLEKKITSRTKAIIPVHLYGQPANMREIMRLAKKHGLYVIEDCAQAHGASYKGKKVGSIGTAGCFSFYPGKNLGAMGDGGMITTNNKTLYEKLKLLHYFGDKDDKYHHEIVGFNSCLDNIQAAVLRIKLRHLAKWNEERINAAKIYNRLLKGFVETPKVLKNAKHVYHLYVIKVEKRDQLLKKLHSDKIYAGLHYPIPLHFQNAHKRLGYKKGDFPNCEYNARHILSLPIFPGITKQEVGKIASSVREFLGR